MRTEKKTTDQILSIDFLPYTVEKTSKQLTPTTSTGPDGVPNILLKHCATSLAVPLSHLFDTSFKDGIPAEWKIANVLPALKKRPSTYTDPSYYRLIPLTSACCRVMERIINNQFLNYVELNKLISKEQHGFLR
jgi:hypothetical protein